MTNDHEQMAIRSTPEDVLLDLLRDVAWITNRHPAQAEALFGKDICERLRPFTPAKYGS